MSTLKDSLLKILTSLAAGPLSESDSKEVERLIAGVWESLTGDEGGMRSEKLLGRTENIAWEPPVLSFQIERHGGFVMGSSRAEIQRWTVDTNTWTASCGRAGFRQSRPQNKPLRVQPLIAETVELIERHAVDTEWLQWLPDGRVKVRSGQIIPDKGLPKMTLTGRRKRFLGGLEEALHPRGWTRWPLNGPPIFAKAALKALPRSGGSDEQAEESACPRQGDGGDHQAGRGGVGEGGGPRPPSAEGDAMKNPPADVPKDVIAYLEKLYPGRRIVFGKGKSYELKAIVLDEEGKKLLDGYRRFRTVHDAHTGRAVAAAFARAKVELVEKERPKTESIRMFVKVRGKDEWKVNPRLRGPGGPFPPKETP